MGLFSPYKRKDAVTAGADPAPAETTPAESQPKGPVKKSVPTPTRKAAEQARRERLTPHLDPKQARARDRQANREARIRQMEQTDKTPARSLARDYIDSRWTIAEWLMPMLLVTVVLAMVAQQLVDPAMASTLMSGALIFSYGTLLATVVEIFLRWRSFKTLLRERLPGESPKGLLFYFSNRMISIRGMRQPKPLYRRGDNVR